MKTNVLVFSMVALVLISIIGVYLMPLGLRGVLSEGFENTMKNKLAHAEKFQDVQPAVPSAMNTDSVLAGGVPKPSATTRPTTTVPNAGGAETAGAGPSNGMMPGGGAVTMPGGTNRMVGSNVQMAPVQTNQAMMNTAVDTNTDNVPTSTEGFQTMNNNMAEKQGAMYRKEGFTTNYAEVSGGSGSNYQAIGAFDGVTLNTGNNVSTWRYTAPNEKLLGAAFAPGDDSLFIFKNNQCKPECCGSSFSCSGGCVCTTPDQRQYIAGRGGNRTRPQED